MSRLPQPVRQAAPFQELTQALFSGLGTAQAVLGADAADDQREIQQTVDEQNLERAQHSVAMSDQRVALMQQRITNEELKIRYAEAVELERGGLAKIMSQGTPDERSVWLNKYPFISKENKRATLRQHGTTLAILDRDDARAAITEYWSRPDAVAGGLTVEMLMEQALEKRGDLPPESRLSYQATFIGSAEALIEGATIRNATKRQANAETDGTRDILVAIEQWAAGHMPWMKDDDTAGTGSVEGSFGTLAGLQPGREMSANEKAVLIEDRFLELHPTFAGDFKAMRDRYDELPDWVKKARPNMLGRIEALADKWTKQNRNAANAKLISLADKYKVESTLESQNKLRNMIAHLSTDDRNDRFLMETLGSMQRTLDNRLDQFDQYRDIGITEGAIQDSKDFYGAFHTTYDGQRVALSMWEVGQKAGINTVLNQISGADWSSVAEMVLRAETREDARDIAQVFANPSAREGIAVMNEVIKENVTTNADVGDGKTLKAGWDQLKAVKRKARIAFGRFIGSPLAQGEPKVNAEKVWEGVLQTFNSAHEDVRGYPVSGAQLGVDWENRRTVFETGLQNLDTTGRLNGGITNVHGAFSHGSRTYVPSISLDGNPVAFLMWDPNSANASGQVVTPTTEPDLFHAAKRRFGMEFTDRERMAYGEDIHHDDMPSRYIRDADDLMFPGDPGHGYWPSLQRRFNQFYTQFTGEPVPELDPTLQPQPPEPTEEPGAAGQQDQYDEWLSDHNRYQTMLGVYLENRGWARQTRASRPSVAPTPPVATPAQAPPQPPQRPVVNLPASALGGL